MKYKNIFSLFIVLLSTNCPIIIHSAATAPTLEVEQRTDILAQAPGLNLCGYHSLWNIRAEQKGLAIANKRSFSTFKNRCQRTFHTGASNLAEAELWRIMKGAGIPNTLIIPNGNFLTGDIEITPISLQAIYAGDDHTPYLITALRNYRDGQKIYCIINPRHVSIGEGGGSNGDGHWFVIALQKTITGNHVTIFESLQEMDEDEVLLDELIAQKLSTGCDDIEQARKEAEEELGIKEHSSSSTADRFVDRRAWAENLVELLSSLILISDLDQEVIIPAVLPYAAAHGEAAATEDDSVTSRTKKRRASRTATKPDEKKSSPTSSPPRKRKRTGTKQNSAKNTATKATTTPTPTTLEEATSSEGWCSIQ